MLNREEAAALLDWASDLNPGPWRAHSLHAARAAEAIRSQGGPWREDWQLSLRRSFSRENFFLSPEGLRFFWQMYALGGAELGVPSFLLPYGEGGCRFPGQET